MMLLGALAAGRAQGAQELTLVQNGQPACTIVVAPEPTRVTQLAALELQYYLGKITGAEAPIRPDDGIVGGTLILVGDTPTGRSLGLDSSRLREQGYVVQFRPHLLVLLGRDQADTGHVTYDMNNLARCGGFPGFFDEQGTLYATYDFLQKYCGVRWFNQTELGTVYPQQDTLVVKGENLQRKPFFRYRYALGAAGGNVSVYDSYTALWQPADAEYQAWDATAYAGLHRQYPDAAQFNAARTNMSYLFLLRMREGGAPMVCNHSMYGYYGRFWDPQATPKLFVERRPDYFAQGYEGQPPQMCYTSPGLVKQLAQDAADYYDGKSTGGEQGIFWNPVLPNPFPVEPMDNSAFCKCAACRALYEQSPAPESPFFSTGRYTDYFFQFVNAVTKTLNQTHPDAKVVTLAYYGHAARPSFPLDPNVIVEFCFTRNRMPSETAQYAHEVSLLRDWAQDNRELYLWLYDTSPLETARNGKYHCFPGFFAHTLGEQMRLFAELGVRGMFHCGYAQEVEAYLTFRLMDDPSLEVAALLNDYFTKMYGPAAVPMKTMYVEMEEAYSEPRPPQDTQALRGAEMAWGVLGTAQRMTHWQALLDQAQALAQTDVQRARIAAYEHGTWTYMTAGRRQYTDQTASQVSRVGGPRMAGAG
jgi:hypothetical protein